jgi:hypothetical protein
VKNQGMPKAESSRRKRFFLVVPRVLVDFFVRLYFCLFWFFCVGLVFFCGAFSLFSRCSPFVPFFPPLPWPSALFFPHLVLLSLAAVVSHKMGSTVSSLLIPSHPSPPVKTPFACVSDAELLRLAVMGDVLAFDSVPLEIDAK